MQTTTTGDWRLSHVAIGVRNLDVSIQFYEKVFDFKFSRKIEIINEHGDLLGVSGDLHVQSAILEHKSMIIELIQFIQPVFEAEPAIPPLTAFGLTHMSLIVADIDAVLPRLKQVGGTVLSSTRTSLDTDQSRVAELIFVADPDGTRIELIRLRR